MPWKVSWRVSVDGADMSDRMNPFLISIEVTDRDGTASDTAALTFDDSDGQCILPRPGARVAIDLQAVNVFAGIVDETRSRGDRGGGRTLAVSCKGFDGRGKAKESLIFHKDDTTLGDFLGEAAQRAGLAGITVDPAFARARRNHWSADGETFLHLGRRLAEEFGATFKVRGDRAVLAKRGTGATPGGQVLPTVRAQWGGNLMSWDIAPFTGRRRFGKARVRYFDRKAATWKDVDVEIDRAGAPATNVVRYPKAEKAQAEAVGDARRRESEREGGEGSVKIDLDPSARAEGACLVAGARPGVDGLYRIVGVTHRAARSGGAETSLELKQPHGEAGKDGRSPSARGR
jgi:uncharacterized protein